MKFRKLFLAFLFAELLSLTSFANPGDTTWVTVYNLRKLTHYGNYDTTAVFPIGKRYRKIRMHYILGRYACAPTDQYCGSWDYTTQIFARPSNADSVEIARVITPYATDWLSQNKKHDYIIDVTDYAPILDSTIAMRFNYSGYSWGFTITLKLEFIEGIPPMDALSAKNIYEGYFAYGNAANSIENYLTPKTFSYSTNVSKIFVKNTVSGHGADSASGCSEFCNKYYDLRLNNNIIANKQIWRNNCGLNEVYPQTGTWVFDRGGWCPGAVVWPVYHDLTNYTGPITNYTVNIDMEPYTTVSPGGGYNFETQFIEYSAPNHSSDAAIEDIISPTKDDNYFRENPACVNPVVKIRNTGTDTLKSVVFNYGLQGGTVLTHTWTGTLAFLAETSVVFPSSAAILSGTSSSVFEVSITNINGGNNDQYADNNIYRSQTTPVSIYPKDFIVKMLTNKSTDTISGYNETRWKLEDENGILIAQRKNLSNNKFYLDTLRNLNPGCYKMTIDDGGCDGYDWWYYPYYPTNPGTGFIRFDYINANNSIASFQGDFGCNMTRYFYVKQAPSTTGIAAFEERQNSIEVFPNPADQTLNLQIDLNETQNLQVRLLDLGGRIVYEKNFSKMMAGYESIDLKNLSNGVYFVSTTLEDGSVLTKKIVVQH